jgi:anti-sigma factor RsiW
MQSDCERVRDLLSLYVMGDLEDGVQRAVREHLDKCPGCRGALAEFTALRRALEEERRPEPGDEFWRRFEDTLMQNIDREARRGRTFTDVLGRLLTPFSRLEPVRVAAGAAAILAVVLLGTLFVRQARERYSEPAGTFADLGRPAAETVTTAVPLSVFLEGMDETDLSRVWEAVASMEVDIDLPEAAVDAGDGTITDVAYSTYAELEYMEEIELEQLELAIERWQGNS